MAHFKFDVSKMERLNDEGRFDSLIPEVMWAALGSPSPRTIIDIGAGTGLFARRFAVMAPSAIVYAADSEPRMIRWMTEHPDPAAGEQIRPILSEETRVPLPDGIADLALMINLHHELEDPAATYREAARLVAGGGQILVADWAPGNTVGGPPQAIRASADEIGRLLSGAGFESVIVHPGLPRHSLLTATRSERSTTWPDR